MAISLADLFPMLRSAKGSAIDQSSAHHWERSLARRKPGGHRRAAPPRASAISFETFEPRILLSGDDVFNVAKSVYLDPNNASYAIFGDDLVSELDGALDIVDNVADVTKAAQQFGDLLGTQVPGLLERAGIIDPTNFTPPTLGDILGKDGANAIDFAKAIRDVISPLVLTAGSSPVTLVAALDGLTATIGNFTFNIDLLDVDPNTAGVQKFILKNVGGNNYEYLFRLELKLTGTDAEDTFSLDPGRNADGLELAYGAAVPGTNGLPGIALSGAFRIETILGIKATIVEEQYDANPDPDVVNLQPRTRVTTTGFFLRDPSFTQGISADVATPAFEAPSFGFLDITAKAGTADFDMYVGGSFSGDFGGAGSLSNPTIIKGGNIEVLLPVEVKIDAGSDVNQAGFTDGFSNFTPVVRLYTTDPFASVHSSTGSDKDHRTAISIELKDFDRLNPFRNIDASSVANLVSGLGTLFEQLQSKAELFGLKLPLLDSTKVSDVLQFGGPLQTLYEKLTKIDSKGVRVADFVDVQTFVAKLKSALADILNQYNTGTVFADIASLLAINPRYDFSDPNKPTLLFTIDLNAAPTGDPITLDGDLGVPLGPIGDVAVSGNLNIDSSFSVKLTLGIELVEAPEVGIKSVLVPSALVSLIRSDGTNPVSDGTIAGSDPVKFSLVLGGQGSVIVTLPAGSYTDAAGLAAALQTAIQGAISAAVTAKQLPAPAAQMTVSVNAQGRLVMSNPTLPYLQLINRGSAAAFAELGFADAQRGSVSPLPANGRLSGDAAFVLRLGDVEKTITLAASQTWNNTSLQDLVGDLNAELNKAGNFGTPGGDPYVSLVGDSVVGFQLKFADGAKLVRIDGTNAVARAELGLADDGLSSPLLIFGQSYIAFGPNSQANALPADGNSGNISFTVRLVQGTDDTGAITVNAAVTGNGVDANNLPLTASQSALEAAKDINTALAAVIIPGTTNQRLSSVLVAMPVEFLKANGEGTGKWGIRLVQPAATLGTPLKYAFADQIQLGNVGDDKLGLANDTVKREGTRVTSTLSGDAVFTLNLTKANGIVDRMTITLDDGAITNTVQGVVDAINSAIAGNATLANKVFAGLDGARIVLAVVDTTTYSGISLSSVNAKADVDMGLGEGMSARRFEGVQAFIEDIHLDAALNLSGAASGSANFGFVALSLGSAEASLQATVDADFGVTKPIYLKDIFDAFKVPLNDPIKQDLIDLLSDDGDTDVLGLGPDEDEEIDLRGSAFVKWEGADISIGATGDSGIIGDLTSELGEVAAPSIHVNLPDITDFDTLTVAADLGSLEDLADFSFDDVLTALRAVADWLKSYVEQLDIVNEELPLLGVSLADVLDFVDDFSTAIDELSSNPTKSLQGLLDKVNESLQQFAGPLVAIGYQANSPGILTFNLKFERQFADTLPLEVDVVDLLEGTGITVPGLKLNGAANLEAMFSIDAELVLGVNVDALAAVLDDPVHAAADVLQNVFMVVEDNDANNIDGYTHLELSAYAAAENVTFIGALGPLGLFVTNGGAVLNKNGQFGNTDPASIAINLPDVGADDGYITLKDLFNAANLAQIFNPDNVDVNLGVAATLPVYFPTSSSFIGNFDFTALVTDPFSSGGIDFDVKSVPDFSKIDLDSLGLLDTLNLFLAGADTVLGTLGDLITGELFGDASLEGMPLVGDALADAGAFIDEIRNEVIPRITNVIETAPELAAGIFEDIGNVIQDALDFLSGPGMVLNPGSSVVLQLLDGNGEVTDTFSFAGPISDPAFASKVLNARGFAFVLDLNVHEVIEAPNVDLNLEVFQLEITKPIKVVIDADLTFGIGVSLDDGFFFKVNPDGESDLSGSLTIDLPNTIEAQLFFLTLTAKNNNTGPDLAGAFSVDLVGTDNGRIGFGDIGNIEFDVDFGAEVKLDLELDLGFPNEEIGIGLPSVKADFDFAWGFGDITVNGQQFGVDADHPETPKLSLGNLRLDIGSFFNDTIGPFVSDVYEILEPIDPILDIITNPLPVVSELIGPTSLLDLAATFGVVNPSLVTALEVLDQLVDFAAQVSNGSQGEITLLPGTITIGGGDGINLTDVNQVGALSDPTQKIGDVLNSLSSAFGINVPQGVEDALAFIASGFTGNDLNGIPGAGEGGGFSFPFLDDYSQVLGLFFGRNMTLVNYDLPPLTFGFDLSIYVPIWGPLGARFTGGVGATIDLAFGFDTEGVQRFIKGGYNPLDIVQGFFVYDDGVEGSPNQGIDVPELLLTGKITAAAELNAVVASAGVGGGIFASIGFDLADPNEDLRIRLDELLANLYNGFEQGVGPLGLFDVDALIEAKLFAYIEALFGVWKKEFQIGPSIPLYEKHYEVPHDPVLATDLENGTLRLNIGDFASDRAWTNNGADEPVDGDETIDIKIVSSKEIWVRGRGPDFDESADDDWQVYKSDKDFTRILGLAALGNDVVKVVQDSTGGAVIVELSGGAGNDELQGGAGNDKITGDGGEDHLIGGGGNDTLDGSAGADCIEGGDGNDMLIGGAGDDVLRGGANDDVLLGNEDNDILSAGAGADTALGGDGSDLIAGGADNDVLMGEAGPDRIWGDQEFEFGTDCVLDLVVGTDEPMFVALGTEGVDYISGGGGSDELLGNGGDDRIWGDSSFQLDGNYDIVFDSGVPVLVLPAFGSFGGDNISGGAGGDTIFGEAGNDLIRGDNLRVDNENDGNPFTWVEGDRFSRGVDDGVADGNDTIDAGSDSDIVYGNGGEDVIAGGTENDILFGNAGDDTLTGDVGADVIFGDNGVVEIFEAGDNDQIIGGPYGAATQDFRRLEAKSEAGDGDDDIDGGQDGDIIFGGSGLGLQASSPDVGQTIEDLIKAGSGDDIVFGDQGKVLFTYVKAAGASFATLITSVDKAKGGDDQIFGSTGRDVLIGGKGGDYAYGDDGYIADDPDSRDVVAGDHIEMTQDVLLVSITPSALVADTYVAAPKKIVSSEEDPSQGGDDTLDGRQDDDFLIGGPGDDDGTGGRGNDVLLGDRGQIDFDLTGINAADPTFVFDRSDLFVLKQVKSTDLNPATDIPFTGIDELSGGAGNDVVIGGGRGDILYGDQEIDGSFDPWLAEYPANVRDILLGDNGQVDYAQLGQVKKVFTTDTVDTTGGEDTISGNQGADIALGGVLGDTIYGDNAGKSAGAADGDDVLLGDNGALEWLSTGRLNEISGIDIAANNPDLWTKYGTGVADTDITTLDLVTTQDPSVGGRDTIYGDSGRDMMFGGSDVDTMYGDSGTDDKLSANGNDIMFGDHGRVYPQFSRYMVGGVMLPSELIFSRNFFAIDTGSGKRGQGDRMWGEEGDDVMLGQQGDDRMWGGDGNDDMIGGHNVAGGLDELGGDIEAKLPAVQNVNLVTDDMNDLMDGGAGDDAMAGDNAIVWRRGDDLNPRFRALTASSIYTTGTAGITANIGATWQSDPADAIGRDIELLDHSDTTAAGLYGQDVMAGGADDDTMFGQLGDDLMQGDGSIGTVGAGAPFIVRQIDVTDSGSNPDTDATLYFNIPEVPATDGNDYMEGNGGRDLMYGGLGQDDMIGGSSALFGLTTEAMRPDDSDTMFGGAGIDIARNHIGDATEDASKVIVNESYGNGRDADYMMGDNANVYRLVQGGASGTNASDAKDVFLAYNYDSGYEIRIIPRAMQQLDYTLGGADYNRSNPAAAYVNGAADLDGTAGPLPADNGAADLIHGESGDDVIFGMTGSDVLFGEGQDDDIVGGYGHDWISGGTGQDGILGDDGLVLTSRNSTLGEPLNGIAGLLAKDPEPRYAGGNVLDEYIATPGSIQTATINVSGQLKKSIDLVPFSYDSGWLGTDDEYPDNMGAAPFADDIIFGGLGSDFLHGGSGDDAISGAEALVAAFVPVYDGTGAAIGVYDLGYAAVGVASALIDNPPNMNPGNVLAYNREDTDGQHLNNRFRAGEFRLYDEYDPRREILLTATGELSKTGAGVEFLLNFAEGEGVIRPAGTVPKAVGQQTETYPQVNDDGADAIFGDLGNDWLVGGTGRDNAYGGWGNDLMNVDDNHSTNTGMNDQPDTHPTYEDRAYGGAGRDVLIANTGGDRLIDWVGEYNSYLVPYAPFGQASVSRTLQPFLPEFLYALSAGDGADPTRASYVGDPRNGEPSGELGLVLQKDQAWQDQTGAPADPQAGNIPGGARDVLRSADFTGNQAQGFVAEAGSWRVTNGRYEVSPLAGSGTTDAISLYYVDAAVPTYFEVAATINAVKPTAGFKANAYVIFDYVSPTSFKFAGINVSTNKFEIGQRTAAGWQVLTSINVLVKQDTDYNLLVAINGNTVTAVLNGKQSLSYAYQPRTDADGFTYNIRDGMIGLGGDNARARIDNVRVQVIPPAITYTATDNFDGSASSLLTAGGGTWGVQGGRYVGTPAAGAQFALAINDISVGMNSLLKLDTVVNTAATGGIVFDVYSPTDFKWAAVSVATQQVLIGHYTAKGGWVVDAAVSRTLAAGTDYALGVTLKGTTVNVTLNGQSVVSKVFNSTVVDGGVGTFARGGSASFDSFSLSTDDQRFAAVSTSTSSTKTTTSATSKLSFQKSSTDAGAAKGWRIDWNAKSSAKRAGGEGLAKGRAPAWQEDFVLNLGGRAVQNPNEGLRVRL